MWRAVRFTGTYKDDSSSADEEEEDFGEGLDFAADDEEPETVEHIRRRLSSEAAVVQVASSLNETLQPEVDPLADPREHFSPVRVTFPVNAPPLRPPVSSPVMANFEDENGDDDAGALREAMHNVSKLVWDIKDLPFIFNRFEINLGAAGVKKNYTKFQILSNCLPKEIQA